MYEFWYDIRRARYVFQARNAGCVWNPILIESVPFPPFGFDIAEINSKSQDDALFFI